MNNKQLPSEGNLEELLEEIGTRRLGMNSNKEQEVYTCQHGVNHERGKYCSICLKEAVESDE